MNFIKEQQARYDAVDAEAKKSNQPVFPRPENYIHSLKRHLTHLQNVERPFENNEQYDTQSKHINRLMRALEPKVQLTKTELLMLLNHRPTNIDFLLPLIEDVEARYTVEEQQFIVEQVCVVLGGVAALAPLEQEDGDATMAEG